MASKTWKDTSSYSQSDKERKPWCFKFELCCGMKITLVWIERYCSNPGTWSTSMYGVYENVELNLKYEDLEKAKKMALIYAEEIALKLLSEIRQGY